MPKRLLFIVDSLRPGGDQRHLLSLALGLPRDEWQVSVAALERGGPLVEELAKVGVPIEVFSRNWNLDPRLLLALRRFIKAQQPDLVQSWGQAASIYARIAGGRRGPPQIVVERRRATKNWADAELERRLRRRTTRRLVLHESQRADRRFAPPEQFAVVPPGVPPATETVASREELLAEFCLPPEARLIACGGSLRRDKRFDQAIWVADMLRWLHPDAYLVIFGDGPRRADLRRFAKLMRIADRVVFAGERADYRRWLPRFDLFWRLGRHDVLPQALLEAMAAGVTVVSVDTPAMRGLVDHDQTGILIPPGSRAALTKFTHQLLEDAPRAARLAAAGQLRVQEMFPMSAMLEQTRELYRSLLGR